MTLLPNELVAVQHRLRRRFVNRRYPHVVSVGIGWARIEGKPDSEGRFRPTTDEERGLCVCFHVRKKPALRHIPKSQRLPNTVKLLVIREGRRFYVELPTDVLNIAGLEPTGVVLSAIPPDTTPLESTGGLIVTWAEGNGADPASLCTGILSVGHAFQTNDDSFGGKCVHIVTGCDAIYLGRANDAFPKIDASVLLLTRPEEAIGSVDGLQLGGPPRSYADLKADVARRAKGQSLRPQRSVNFVVQEIIELLPVQTVGKLSLLLRVESQVDWAFQKGTSGAVWTVFSENDVHLAAYQVAGDDTTFYRTGYAHILAMPDNRIGPLEWCENRLADVRPGFIPGSFSVEGGC